MKIIDSLRFHIIRLLSLRKLKGNKQFDNNAIYLTFDDGPTRFETQEILNKLQVYGIKASFFVTGRNVERYPESLEDIFRRGHYIACRSYTPDLESIYSSADAFINEIKQYENAIIEAIGKENFEKYDKIMRFPGGTNNAMLTKTESLQYIAKAKELGYSIYDWTALTGDEEEGEKDPQTLVSNLASSLSKAKNAGLDLIVLMHDDNIYTSEALNDILAFLLSEGYYFDTINHCAEYTFVED